MSGLPSSGRRCLGEAAVELERPEHRVAADEVVALRSKPPSLSAQELNSGRLTVFRATTEFLRRALPDLKTMPPPESLAVLAVTVT